MGTPRTPLSKLRNIQKSAQVKLYNVGWAEQNSQFSRFDMPITRRTLLILGAGASYPYGFPLGRQLIFNMSSHPTTYKISHPGYSEHGLEIPLHVDFKPTMLQKFRQELLDSGMPSIDAFLGSRPEYRSIGKAAIAATLIPCEVITKIERQEPVTRWYEYLRYNLGETPQEVEASLRNLSLVTFNYDRSLEYFLFRSFVGSYGDRKKASNLFSLFEIVHIYGELGRPDFLSSEGRPYSPQLTPQAIAKCVNEIKIIPEGEESSANFDSAHSLVQKADVISFLGFGYNEKNLQRLKINELFRGDRVICSAYGLGNNESARLFAFFEPINKASKTGGPAFSVDHSHYQTLEFLQNYPVLS